METVVLIGRIVVGVYFLMAAMNHFRKSEMMAGYASSRGMKGGKGLIMLSGLILLLGGLGVLLGIYVHIAIWLLVIFLVVASFGIHHFWGETDPQKKMAEMQNFMKNLALAGVLLMLLAIPTPWAFSVL